MIFRARVELLLLLALLSCQQPAASPLPPPASSISTQTPPLPNATLPPADSGWEMLRPGLERRRINIIENQAVIEQLYLLRIDGGLYRFDVAYDPHTPLTLEQWLTTKEALVVANGGYYSHETENDPYTANGLVIAGGQSHGFSYGDFAGMLAVDAQGAGLRWLRQQPYDPGEPLLAALQSFPLLVKPGGELGFPAEYEDNRQARRTVIAQDRQGRLLLLAANQMHFTLHTLSAYLTASDLDLHIALNLDGGPSTGILLAEPEEGLPAYTPLPLVILVYAR